MDFVGLHNAIRKKIEREGFIYIRGDLWGNLSMDQAPAQWVNKGFNVKFEAGPVDVNKTEYRKWLNLTIVIEFMADNINDGHLAVLSAVIDAVDNGLDAAVDFLKLDKADFANRITNHNSFDINYYGRYSIIRFTPAILIKEV